MEQISVKVNDKDIIFQTGLLAKQADGSVVVQCEGTLVLVTSVCSKKAKQNMGFFPLTVEYQERTYAAGNIPGGFFKREGRPTEKEILTSRMIDRPIRPLFPKNMLNEVQVIATVLSSDGKNNSDILAILGASLSLCVSDIPFDGPIGSVRVGLIDDKFVINPSFDEMEKSDLDLVVVANENDVVMLEVGANVISEEKIVEAIKVGHDAIKPIIDIQKQFIEKFGKEKRTNISFFNVDEEVFKLVNEKVKDQIVNIFDLSDNYKKQEQLELLKQEILDQNLDILQKYSEDDIKMMLDQIFSDLEKKFVRDMVLKEKKRFDNRRCDEIRSLDSKVNILPSTHGSGLFTRGKTQSLSVVTLGSSSDEQKIEKLEGESIKKFMLHYNFPPFSVGETRPMRGPGRREIGHGALAEKALKVVLPDKDIFPYTIRIVSEILESNGSSSMATVCAGTLSLMDAGVPIKNAVSGIAMGIIIGENDYTILTDIAGVEDHYGDMDFKVAGTRQGVTAVQMDLKVKGLSYQILEEAFQKAKKARLEILDNMESTIKEPNKYLSVNAPRIVTIKVKTDKIRDIIGPGGKIIRKIIAETGADVNIDDEGICQILSQNKESLDKAIEWINGIIEEPEIGKIYNAKIIKITTFGAFCEFLPGKEGLLHVSEISNTFVKDVSDIVKEGQELKVKVIDIDDQGRVKLSVKQIEEN